MTEHKVSQPPEYINQNVETIASLRARSEAELSTHQRGIERITAALGRPRSIYVVLAVVLLWVGFNSCARMLGARPPDPPPFEALQALVGLAALVMTIMVLTTQNRQSKQAEQRDHLDLQVNLLAEQKVAKLIALIEELRRDLPAVPNRVDRLAEVMTEPLDPTVVVDALEGSLDVSPDRPSRKAGAQGGTADKAVATARRPGGRENTLAAEVTPGPARGSER
jgi:uncharacterized membrane protein